MEGCHLQGALHRCSGQANKQTLAMLCSGDGSTGLGCGSREEAHPAWFGGKRGGRGGAVLGQGPQRSRAPDILLEPLWVPSSSQLSLQADLWGPHQQALALHLPIRVWALGTLAGDWKEGRGGGQSIYFLGSFLMGSFGLALSLPCVLLLLPEQFLSLWVQVAAPSLGPWDLGGMMASLLSARGIGQSSRADGQDGES